MKHDSYAKIVATLGPASSSPSMIEKLYNAGADVFRLNFSHGEHEYHKETLKNIRKMSEKVGRSVAVFADLQGPKLRVGKFKNGPIELKARAKFRLDMSDELGDQRRVTLPHKEIFAAMKKGMKLLLNDGIIKLRVDDFGSDWAETTVIFGGTLSDRKGVNVPDVELPISALTEKDRRDLDVVLGMDVDYIALSFVQRPSDIKEARKLIGNKDIGIISKIEKPSAIEYIEEIVELSDAIMIARGDLGVECPAEIVPGLQKKIIKLCRKKGKPVIVATQMLETMVTSSAATRAEASDIATAVYDGADALMLSAETAAGKYPVRSVSTMDKIINSTESDEFYSVFMDASRNAPEHTGADAITSAATTVAKTVKNAKAIVTYTSSGSTTLRAARERPGYPIVCITPSIKVARKMCLVWGVQSTISRPAVDLMEIKEKAVRHTMNRKMAKNGDKLIITAGVPFAQMGITNILYTLKINKDDFPHLSHLFD
jgi:pyruvate kinase